MFDSFRVRDFRIYWIGMFVSLCGTWIQSTAQSWLVYELTNSSFLLGVVGFVTYAPFLFFSFLFGVLVDRVDKRRLILLTQVVFMCLAATLAVLTHTGRITVPGIMMLSFLYGIVLSLDAPARHAFIFDIVGKTKILNAVALNSIAFHGARMLGPALAGIFVATITIAGCFYINTISFFAFIIALLVIRIANQRPARRSGTMLQELSEAFTFLKQNQILISLIATVGMLTLFGFSYVVLLPVYARSVLHLGVRGYGFLMSASGIGSLLGALLLARTRDLHTQPRQLIASMFLFSLALLMLGVSRHLPFSLFALTVIGFSSLRAAAIINSLIQTIATDAIRGRMMSLYMFTFAGAIPFGSLLAGLCSQMMGVSAALCFFAVVCFVCAWFSAIRILPYKVKLVNAYE